MQMTIPKFDPTWNLGHVLIFVGMILGGLGGGLTVYQGVIGQLTRVTLDVERLKELTGVVPNVREQQINNTSQITQLREAVGSIKTTNEKLIEQVVGLRLDFAEWKGRSKSGDLLPPQ